jgi:hypothetical protein
MTLFLQKTWHQHVGYMKSLRIHPTLEYPHFVNVGSVWVYLCTRSGRTVFWKDPSVAANNCGSVCPNYLSYPSVYLTWLENDLQVQIWRSYYVNRVVRELKYGHVRLRRGWRRIGHRGWIGSGWIAFDYDRGKRPSFCHYDISPPVDDNILTDMLIVGPRPIDLRTLV